MPWWKGAVPLWLFAVIVIAVVGSQLWWWHRDSAGRAEVMQLLNSKQETQIMLCEAPTADDLYDYSKSLGLSADHCISGHAMKRYLANADCWDHEADGALYGGGTVDNRTHCLNPSASNSSSIDSSSLVPRVKSNSAPPEDEGIAAMGLNEQQLNDDAAAFRGAIDRYRASTDGVDANSR